METMKAFVELSMEQILSDVKEVRKNTEEHN